MTKPIRKPKQKPPHIAEVFVFVGKHGTDEREGLGPSLSRQTIGDVSRESEGLN